MAQTKINVHRYTQPQPGYAGYIEPEGRQWVVFFTDEGECLFYADRDPETGAVIGEGIPGGTLATD